MVYVISKAEMIVIQYSCTATKFYFKTKYRPLLSLQGPPVIAVHQLLRFIFDLFQDSVSHAVSGLTVVTAILFITGEMTGSGVLALPKAVKDAGWVRITEVFQTKI